MLINRGNETIGDGSIPPKYAENRRGRPFPPGSGGRPKGARNKATLAVEGLMEGELETLTRKVIERAREGDMVAMKICLDRIAPPRRDRPIRLELPSVVTADDAVKASSEIIQAVADGEISPSEAAACMALLATHRKFAESADIHKRLQELEQQLTDRAYEEVTEEEMRRSVAVAIAEAIEAEKARLLAYKQG